MLVSTGQAGDLADIFESAVNLEDQHIQQGYNEGFKDGVELGKAEGRDVGLKTGFETGEELGFYRGCINIWKAAIEVEPTVFSARVQKNLKQLEELADSYPLLDPENESVQDILGAMRTKFRVICATLSVHLEYEGFRTKFSRGHLPHVFNVRCNAQQVSLKPVIQFEATPILQSVKAFAPATIANLGPGFDFLGCAVEGLGDHVTVEVNEDVEPGKIVISFIDGDNNRLSLNPMKNCAGIAAKATMELLGVRSVGLSLGLHKGLPLGSGLGSSAASAAAAAVAVNGLFGNKLTKSDLVLAGLESEAAVSGYHADNVAPSLMGGFVLVRSYSPLDLIHLPFPSEKELFFVLVTPAFEAPTKEMRAVLPKNITMKDHIQNCSQAAALVAAILQGDPCLLGAALSSDSIVEPKRGPFIPGMMAVKAAALETGAFGCTISGAGPTAVAITDTAEKGKAIAVAMVDMFQKKGQLEATASIQKLDRIGARVV